MFLILMETVHFMIFSPSLLSNYVLCLKRFIGIFIRILCCSGISIQYSIHGPPYCINNEVMFSSRIVSVRRVGQYMLIVLTDNLLSVNYRSWFENYDIFSPVTTNI